jgi:hypothetical protein
MRDKKKKEYHVTEKSSKEITMMEEMQDKLIKEQEKMKKKIKIFEKDLASKEKETLSCKSMLAEATRLLKFSLLNDLFFLSFYKEIEEAMEL